MSRAPAALSFTFSSVAGVSTTVVTSAPSVSTLAAVPAVLSVICDVEPSVMSSADASPFFSFTVAGLEMSTVTLVPPAMLMVRISLPSVSVLVSPAEPELPLVSSLICELVPSVMSRAPAALFFTFSSVAGVSTTVVT